MDRHVTTLLAMTGVGDCAVFIAMTVVGGFSAVFIAMTETVGERSDH